MINGNTEHMANAGQVPGSSGRWIAPDASRFRNRSFQGYHRSDGSVGTANYWLFLPMVFCENRNLDVIREALQHELGYAAPDSFRNFTRQLKTAFAEGLPLDQVKLEPVPPAAGRIFKNVDGIRFLNHQGGCGGIRQDAVSLGKLLAAYAHHPNVGGVTVMSLGCQNLQVQDFQQYLKERNPAFDKPLFIFEQQRSLSETALIQEAIQQTFSGLTAINRLERQPAPLSKLCIGLTGNGPDTTSAAIGYCSDLLVALGGKLIRSSGTDHNGMAGTSPVVDRLEYAGAATRPGLSLVETSIHTVEAMTGIAASGANLMLNHAQGGIETGNPVCPVIRIATSATEAAAVDIDIAGLLPDHPDKAAMGSAILEYCIRTASGEEIPSAISQNLDDFIPWKRGVSL